MQSRDQALTKKTVIITGAAGSLGSALSRVCLREHWNVVMLDSKQQGLEQIFDRLVDLGLPEPALHPMDLSAAGPEDFDTVITAMESEFGGLDAVVHCAARFEGLMPLEHVSPSEWLKHLQVNLNAAWLLSTHALPLLRKSPAGRLYFLLEDLSRMEGPFWGPYGISKHALRALVSQFSAECKSTQIQVLGINPGPLSSALRSRAYHAESPMAQPGPEHAAEQIAACLSGDAQTNEVFLDLKRD